MGMKRLGFLGRFAVLVAVAAVCMVAPVSARGKKGAPAAKYVFYFVGDGLGINQVYGTELYNAARRGDVTKRELLPFDAFPVRGYADNWSASSLVTDSSAAGIALSAGMKSVNGYMGTDADKRTVVNLTEIAHRRGMKTGVVTNVGVNHATPSSFYAHCDSRGEYVRIARQLKECGDVDFAAGSTFILRSRDSLMADDMVREFRDAGIVVSQCADEAAEVRGRRVLLLSDSLSRKAMRYAIDRGEGEPSVVGFTGAAIKYLEREDAGKGFFLMVEGGRIDYACHSNDAVTLFNEINDFSAAVDLALAFAGRHPDETLIVVTSDHETGGIALGYRKYCMHIELLTHQTCSIEALSRRMTHLRATGRTGWDDMKALLRESLGFWGGVEITEAEEKSLRKTFDESFVRSADKVVDLYASNEKMASQAIRLLNRKAHITWAGLAHTGMQIPYYAWGAGAENFRGCRDNTDIPKAIAKAMGAEMKH